MASIAISDLYPTGADFFTDSEGFMTELTEDELITDRGGSPTVTASSHFCVGAGVAVVSFVAGVVISLYR